MALGPQQSGSRRTRTTRSRSRRRSCPRRARVGQDDGGNVITPEHDGISSHRLPALCTALLAPSAVDPGKKSHTDPVRVRGFGALCLVPGDSRSPPGMRLCGCGAAPPGHRAGALPQPAPGAHAGAPQRRRSSSIPGTPTMRHDGQYVHWAQGGHAPPFDIASAFFPMRGPYSSGDPRVLARPDEGHRRLRRR